MLGEADRLFGVREILYELDIEEKRKYDFMKQNSYFGYITDDNMKQVSKDNILGLSDPLPAPDVLSKSQQPAKSFMMNTHSVVILVLKPLNKHLQLPQHTLANMRHLNAMSGNQVRSVKAPPQPMDDRQVTLGQHTGFGSITILFNQLGSLQIFPLGKDVDWQYARPLPGHTIVNLGDAMAKFTNGQLRSNIHRVVSPPGAQAEVTRHSLMYFARLENNVILKRLDGSNVIPPLPEGTKEDDIKSQDWILGRALNNSIALHDNIDLAKGTGTEAQSQRIYVYTLHL